MPKIRLYRHEIDGLVDRLLARGTSKMLRDSPEMTRDMRVAAAVLRVFLDRMVMLESMEADVGDTPWQPKQPAAEGK